MAAAAAAAPPGDAVRPDCIEWASLRQQVAVSLGYSYDAMIGVGEPNDRECRLCGSALDGDPIRESRGPANQRLARALDVWSRAARYAQESAQFADELARVEVEASYLGALAERLTKVYPAEVESSIGAMRKIGDAKLRDFEIQVVHKVHMASEIHGALRSTAAPCPGAGGPVGLGVSSYAALGPAGAAAATSEGRQPWAGNSGRGVT